VSRKRTPTAAERTISLFTGMTDLDGLNARDGSFPRLEQPSSTLITRLRWRKEPWSMREWSSGAGHHIERVGEGEYVLSYGGKKRGTYPTIVDAGRAAETYVAPAQPNVMAREQRSA
jgi:hypothetical protein